MPTYVVLGCVAFVLALFISRWSFPTSLDSTEETGSPQQPSDPKGIYARLLRTPTLMFAVLAQFFYVGLQVGTWSTLIPYFRAYTPLGDKASGYFLTGTLVALGIGRIVSTPLMSFINPERMIGFYALINMVLLVVAWHGRRSSARAPSCSQASLCLSCTRLSLR
jgi:FHS family L-fucose permease-like MFS transporter